VTVFKVRSGQEQTYLLGPRFEGLGLSFAKPSVLGRALPRGRGRFSLSSRRQTN
jgi:hypothetical protein